ncbi:hypothetical protein Lesp02_03330 [Lentzea sp. NBRC 105346]|uniref:hypothetical protein n=1 Tax=Lentzea sp. NBRC 105346 TaxID=3032205 RepID=UPI0024A4C059|nr:hypothetical protein [Lentzea sp. NBRC 105346]GLZ28143.1 hypothetical protein Lesp02_03330 [Lentzea sp. NBRC 105346]
MAAPPAGEPSPEELSTPESAARAWLARWCAFDHTEPFAAAEQRARPAMTDLGWRNFDPAGDERARHSWERTVAAKESGRCSAPQAQVPSGAPASDNRRIVLVWADRVVTGTAGSPYVERIMQTRHVHRGADGRWRVDIATVGG